MYGQNLTVSKKLQMHLDLNMGYSHVEHSKLAATPPLGALQHHC
jgi:hypothetical protein